VNFLRAIGKRWPFHFSRSGKLTGGNAGSEGKNRLNADFDTYAKVLRECRVPVMWSIIGGMDNQDAGYFCKNS